MTETHPDPTVETDTRRRRFLNKLWLILAAIGLVEFAWLATTFVSGRRSTARPEHAGKVVSVGRVDDFELDTVTAFQRGRFYLVRLADGGFLAISRQCTHLGCTLPWIEDKKQFVCPCHASAFDMTGAVIASPAPRAMDLFPVRIENNVVRVNTAKRIKRGAYRRQQAVYPSAEKT